MFITIPYTVSRIFFILFVVFRLLKGKDSGLLFYPKSATVFGICRYFMNIKGHRVCSLNGSAEMW